VCYCVNNQSNLLKKIGYSMAIFICINVVSKNMDYRIVIVVQNYETKNVQFI